MFSILRIMNVAGLGGGLISAAVFDNQLTGPWRLALFSALGVLDLIMIIWITRSPVKVATEAPAPSRPAELDDPWLMPAPLTADEAELARQAA